MKAMLANGLALWTLHSLPAAKLGFISVRPIVAKNFVIAAIDDLRGEEEYNALVRGSVAPNRLEQIKGLLRE